MEPTSLQVKPLWKRLFSQSWVLISLLAIVLAIPRFVVMLSAQYNLVIIIFIIMWFTPFLLLTKKGRKGIGLVKPKSLLFLVIAFFIGLASAYLVYLVGYWLYGHTTLHWYSVVMNTFNKGNIIQDIRPNILLFLLISLPTMIFSPIGEEFFFRGIIQDAFSERFGNKIATATDASFFGFTHLAHYGIILSATGWEILPSAFLWIGLMILVSVLLSFVRIKSCSIWGAVICHSGFNLGMMGCIFYLMN